MTNIPVADLVADIMGFIEDVINDAEVDYPAGYDAGPRIQYDSDAIAARILAALTPVSAEPVAWRTGLTDKDGREICLGDRLRWLNNKPHTKKEYWLPEYEVIWDAPSFVLQYIGGGRKSDPAFAFKYYHQEFETIHVAAHPNPMTVEAAAQVLLKWCDDRQFEVVNCLDLRAGEEASAVLWIENFRNAIRALSGEKS